MATVEFKNINKVYANNVQAVFDFNLSVNDKEFIVLVGPSGCGKSTTLRMLAGLEDITDGEILIDGQVVNDLLPKDRNIAMVFQSYALYPHMTVYDNMAFALKIKGVNKQEIEERVNHAAEILALKSYLDRKPKELSGGQRQRVALGRAIVRTPKVFLMDEPLSNLDAKLRVQMRSEIAKIHKKVGATTIYVTHDQTEAMTMANRIVVMKDGFIQQIGTPKEVYNYPENIFVGGFIGSPAMNFINGEFDGKKFFVNGTKKIEIGLPNDKMELLKSYKKEKIDGLTEAIKNQESVINDLKEALSVPTKDKKTNENNEKKLASEEELLHSYEKTLDQFKSGTFPLVLGIRPEDIKICSKEDSLVTLECDITELLGRESIVYSYLNNQRLVIQSGTIVEIPSGDTLYVNFDFSRVHLFDEETTLRIRD